MKFERAILEIGFVAFGIYIFNMIFSYLEAKMLGRQDYPDEPDEHENGV